MWNWWTEERIAPHMAKTFIAQLRAILWRDRWCYYRRRSRTSPSKTFSYDEEYRHRHRYKSLPRKGLGNDVMNTALSQVSKSPFTRNIEDASLPQCFHQPTFTIYNGRTDPVKHVSHFSQKMAVHSKNEALMCKLFPSNLVQWRWDGLTV